jgi:hypothetical protein
MNAFSESEDTGTVCKARFLSPRIFFAFILIFTFCTPALAETAPDIKRDAQRVIRDRAADGFRLLSTGSDYINENQVLTIEHHFRKNHDYVVYAYVERCSSCGVRMQFVKSGQQNTELLLPLLLESGGTTMARLGFPQEINISGRIETFVEAPQSYYATMLFFERSR